MIRISKSFLAILLIGSSVAGYIAGGSGNTLDHLWDKDRDGLRSLNETMIADKSQRAAAVFFTEKGMYSTMAIDANKFYIDCAIKPVPEDQLEAHWKKMHGMKP